MKIDWDTVVDERISSKWESFLNNLLTISEIRVSRFILNDVEGVITSHELHGFADGSKEAFSAAVYLRVVTTHGKIKTTLISAKSKIAPAKIVSIPRLELMSCLLLSKLIISVKEALKFNIEIQRVICWTDSEVALYWIKGLRREWKTWVEHRVCKIRDNVAAEAWHHVSLVSTSCSHIGFLPFLLLLYLFHLPQLQQRSPESSSLQESLLLLLHSG